MPWTLFYFLAIQLVIVAYIDFRRKIISNWWSLLNLVAFPVLGFLIFPQLYLMFSIKTYFLPLVFLLVGFAFFVLRIMGGGDVKYLFSLYLLVPFTYQMEVFGKLLMSTVMIGGLFLVYNSLKNLRGIVFCLRTGQFRDLKQFYGTKFSYAPVILFSWIWFGWERGIF